MYALFLLMLGVATAVAAPGTLQRIVGGSLTTIDRYPFQAGLLHAADGVLYRHQCGGTIFTTTAIISAAQCFHGQAVNYWRVRVGSTFANSGGEVHAVRAIQNHPLYDTWTQDNDISIVRTITSIAFIPGVVASGPIPSVNYVVPDNAIVWASGWGQTTLQGEDSEQLRHVQLRSVNKQICRERYNQINFRVTDNMICSGMLGIGGMDQCTGDSGGPLVHNNVVVGVFSLGTCGSAQYPGINTLVSRYTPWILDILR